MNGFKSKLRYKFDNLMSKGTVAMVGILFLVTAIVVVLVGVVAYLLGQGSIGQNIWSSVMHTIDAGTITAADTGNATNIVLMSIVTLSGLFITSILIGIITTGFEEKLNSLKKGNSQVIETEHTVILGYDDNVYTIISELVIANENRKNPAIVVLSPMDKEEMEGAIAANVPDRKNTRIICRTGSITDVTMLKRCSINTCRSVILNERDDFMTIKAILAINTFFDSCEDTGNKPHVVALINDKENLGAAVIAGQGNVEALLVGDVISRIIAQTCRQPGLSTVLIELFDYDGNELYFENFPELHGKTFGDALTSFRYAVPFGYKRGEEIFMCPDMNDVIDKDDFMLILVEDDGVANTSEYTGEDIGYLNGKLSRGVQARGEHILILGTNDKLPLILAELDNYFHAGSTVKIAVEEDSSFEHAGVHKNFTVEVVRFNINDRGNIDTLIEGDIDHVLMLSDETCDTETSDAKTLLRLIHLRDIMKNRGGRFNITSEMRNTTNQKLAKVAEINDLVVGSNIVNLILSQISENRDLAMVFREILEAEGSEIYIRNASMYAEIGKPVDFYTVTRTAALRGEVAIGHKIKTDAGFEIAVNPDKTSEVAYTGDDEIIVLAR